MHLPKFALQCSGLGSLSSRFITEKQEIEIGALIAALATLLTAIAATISMLRSGRIH
jgi:hypothetical protein